MVTKKRMMGENKMREKMIVADLLKHDERLGDVARRVIMEVMLE